MRERIIIVPYDPAWPRRFEEERAVLAAAFAGSEAAIEHIGSTAVPGLAAKPVIDILIGLSTLDEAAHRRPALEQAGYEYVPEYERVIPQRRYFRKPRFGPREFHLHCVLGDSDLWTRHVAFRDYLRAHPESAAAYEALKRHLAARVPKEEYPDAKGPFIEAVLAAAMRERGEASAPAEGR